MTNLLRMSIALLFQSVAMLFRSVLFFLLALLRPIDMVSDGLQRIAYWLAIDGELTASGIHYKGKPNDRTDE